MARKKNAAKNRCGKCKNWTRAYLDFGECYYIAEFVPGDEYFTTYAYAPCCIETDYVTKDFKRVKGDMFELKEVT